MHAATFEIPADRDIRLVQTIEALAERRDEASISSARFAEVIMQLHEAQSRELTSV